MANVAAGTQCPTDKTLVTCVGDETDAELVGTCPCCSASVAIANLNRVAPPPAVVAQEEHDAALARIAELEAQLASAAPAATATPGSDSGAAA